jgi:hypothetical protein
MLHPFAQEAFRSYQRPEACLRGEEEKSMSSFTWFVELFTCQKTEIYVIGDVV